MKSTKGFTLIELLIVVSVIGVLAGIVMSVINADRIRGSARDAQRASDLGKIQASLELYYAQFRRYPTSTAAGGTDWINITGTTDSFIETELLNGFINRFPEDPSDNDDGATDTPCTDPDRFRYNYRSDGSYYYLTAVMEVAESADSSLCTTITTNMCGTWGSAGDRDMEDYCYVVRNP